MSARDFFLVQSPPRRGGVAAPPRKCRGATKAAQTGWREARVWQGEASIEDRHGRVFAELTTPSAPIKVASRSYWCRGHPSSARRGMFTLGVLSERERSERQLLCARLCSKTPISAIAGQ